jgi:hypothetical protein
MRLMGGAEHLEDDIREGSVRKTKPAF